ncbi:class I SAM-dependent methyltransferase [Simiduia aestuariiviva]|uniref:SAM-dependent methyltransferase n=1 Tax=Simiduia aestuariiviva TaxID=1510459 RepID=A0A839UV03_9GAMM|nr:class I SAM-dependent methyltransferase [Simiduia aestuariiviva]MBB3169185.1 SAM-dependent methyltransferase [Simiduia aestuariiviva]
MSRIAWDSFWELGGTQAFGVEGRAAIELNEYWQKFSQTLNAESVLDLCAGRGAVGTQMLLANSRLSMYGVDYAKVTPESIDGNAAWEEFFSGFDLSKDQLERLGSYDICVSQFGIEYLHREKAFEHFSCLMKPGGRFNFLVHLKGGAIDTMASEKVKELEVLLRSGGVLDTAESFFMGRGSAGEVVHTIQDFIASADKKTKSVSGQVISGIEKLISMTREGHSSIDFFRAFKQRVQNDFQRTESMRHSAMSEDEALSYFSSELTTSVRVEYVFLRDCMEKVALSVRGQKV